MGRMGRIGRIRPIRPIILWKYPSYSRRLGDAIDCQDVGACAHIDAEMLSLLVHLVKSLANGRFKRVIDPIFAPEERILILHPLVIADRHAASVSQDIRNQQHTVVLEYAIRRWCS